MENFKKKRHLLLKTKKSKTSINHSISTIGHQDLVTHWYQNRFKKKVFQKNRMKLKILKK